MNDAKILTKNDFKRISKLYHQFTAFAESCGITSGNGSTPAAAPRPRRRGRKPGPKPSGKRGPGRPKRPVPVVDADDVPAEAEELN